MSVLANCADDVAAVQLRGRQKVERSGKKADPCCPPNGMKKKIRGIGAMVKDWREKLENQRSAEHDFVLGGNRKSGNELCVDDAVDECWNRDEEAHKRPGRANIKERTSIANRGANEDEGAERADQCGEGNKEWIAGVDMMVTTREKMAQFVDQKNRQQRQGEGKAGGQGERVPID